MKLKIDPQRTGKFKSARTGMFVRAQDEGGRWQNVDIIHLDAQSLRTWLRSRGGYSPWAEQVIFMMLDHEEIPLDHPTDLEKLQAGIGVARVWELEVSSNEDSLVCITSKNGDRVPQEAAKQLEKLGWIKAVHLGGIQAYEMYLP